jgi:hypothetical protein
MKTFNKPLPLKTLFTAIMKIANKPSLRQVYVSLLLMLMFASVVQVHNIRNMAVSAPSVNSTVNDTIIMEELPEQKSSQSVLQQFAGVLALPSLVLKTVNEFNGQR